MIDLYNREAVKTTEPIRCRLGCGLSGPEEPCRWGPGSPWGKISFFGEGQCGMALALLFIDCSRVGQTLHRKYIFYTYTLQWSTPIWLDGVQCRGTENGLVECQHRGDWGVNDCNHNDDVSIACYDNSTFPPHCECTSSTVVTPRVRSTRGSGWVENCGSSEFVVPSFCPSTIIAASQCLRLCCF